MTRVDLSRAVWRKSSRSPANGGTIDCVEVAALGGGRIAVRDSKHPGGAVLFLPLADLAALINGVRNDEFSNLA
ncbi:MAG: DUF397 domain-containing protein [Pseudonocardiaceae bacterium]